MQTPNKEPSKALKYSYQAAGGGPPEYIRTYAAIQYGYMYIRLTAMDGSDDDPRGGRKG